MEQIACIILAAGSSARMGHPKQLLDWGGEPLVRMVARTALASQGHDVHVVIGSGATAVQQALADLPLALHVNEAYASGQASSLRLGITALPAHVAAALILLGDQPFVTPTIIDSLICAWRERHAPIIAPVYAGQRGNPVLFDRSMFAQLLTVQGDQGARTILQSRPDIHLVAFDDITPLVDIDTPEAYQRCRPRPA